MANTEDVSSVRGELEYRAGDQAGVLTLSKKGDIMEFQLKTNVGLIESQLQEAYMFNEKDLLLCT